MLLTYFNIIIIIIIIIIIRVAGLPASCNVSFPLPHMKTKQ